MRVIESQYWTLNSLGIYCMNFANYEEKCRNATDASLVYVMKDAREAMLANPEGVKAGYYADEISMAGMELMNRRRALTMLNSPYYKTGGSYNPLCPPSKH